MHQRCLGIYQGNAIIDKAGAEKAAIQVDDILGTFNEISIECGNYYESCDKTNLTGDRRNRGGHLSCFFNLNCSTYRNGI